MQITNKAEAREIIRLSRINKPWQLPTVRGSIYDRNEKELAADKPQFFVHISYQLTKFKDKNFWLGLVYKNVTVDKDFIDTRDEQLEKHKQDREDIEVIIDKCSMLLNVDRETIISKINEINVGIWKLREVVAWKNTFPESELYLQYKKKKREAPYTLAMLDFETRLAAKGLADPHKERFKLALKEDLAESRQLHPIYEIKDREQLFKVQLGFTGIEGVEIAPITERIYHYGAAACQLIGWVGRAQADENALFPNDIYSQYNPDDLSGISGIESACEAILRGRRGEVTYNHDDELLSRKPTQFGEDIKLSIDIELQHAIEKYLSDKTIFPDPNAEMGSVVIDVASGEILAMVSIPTYDLRFIRYSKVYGQVSTAKTKPFKSKAMHETYPPGSIIKPIFLAMGLESGKITANEIIHCNGTDPPNKWPDCIVHRDFGFGHDRDWNNTGRNAIRGSCNIYFSRLADRFSSGTIQSWLYRFGFGHRILPLPNYPELLKELKRSEDPDSRLDEGNGNITSSKEVFVEHMLDLKPIEDYEKRYFGIGQASIRVTVLQVANAMAALARGGIYRAPRLFIGDSENKKDQHTGLGISKATMNVVRDGMHAVVYESHGTANKAYTNKAKDERYFEKFTRKKITLFGKTGSTEKPYNAWFAGFAEDESGRALAFAIFVKRGKSGSKDAAPKGLKILDICNTLGYIGISVEEK